MPKNISNTEEISIILNDINLTAPVGGNKINIYCEDARAVSFLRYVLTDALSVNLDLFMTFIDINLGQSNYIQLAEKMEVDALPSADAVIAEDDVNSIQKYILCGL